MGPYSFWPGVQNCTPQETKTLGRWQVSRAQGKPALQEGLGGMGTMFVGVVRGSGSEAEKAFIARRAAERA